MASLRSILKRYRPAGAPGAAAARAVPADRVAERSAELEPLLVLLDDVEAEAERIRAAAAEDAARHRRDAVEQAAAIAARARVDAAAARADGAARVRAQTDAELAEVIKAGDAALDTMRTRVAERMPGYVGRVVAEVHAMVVELAARDPSAPGPS